MIPFTAERCLFQRWCNIQSAHFCMHFLFCTWSVRWRCCPHTVYVAQRLAEACSLHRFELRNLSCPSNRHTSSSSPPYPRFSTSAALRTWQPRKRNIIRKNECTPTIRATLLGTNLIILKVPQSKQASPLLFCFWACSQDPEDANPRIREHDLTLSIELHIRTFAHFTVLPPPF